MPLHLSISPRTGVEMALINAGGAATLLDEHRAWNHAWLDINSMRDHHAPYDRDPYTDSTEADHSGPFL
jgi:hypothetical protein